MHQQPIYWKKLKASGVVEFQKIEQRTADYRANLTHSFISEGSAPNAKGCFDQRPTCD